jgi:putative nucleotidyltransferase with HDIG domain
MRYTDTIATDKLRNRVEESLAGVVVRDAAAEDRMKSRLSEFRTAWSTNKNTAGFPEVLLNAFLALQEQRGEVLFLAAERVGEVYFKAMAEDLHTPPQDAELWAEIGKLDLPASEANLLYQLMKELATPVYSTDPKLTTLMRQVVRTSIPPVERQLEIGDAIVAQGETITPTIARLLRFQGYPESVFPLGRLAVAALLMLTLPLWLEILLHADSNRPPRISVVFLITMGWVCQTLASYVGAAGAGTLAPVLIAYLSMRRRFAFNICLVGAASSVFLISGLSVYNTLSILSAGLACSMMGYYLLRRIDSISTLAYKTLFLAVILMLVKVSNRAFQGFPVTWQSLTLGWPLGETWTVGGRVLLFDLLTAYLAASLLPMIEGRLGVLSVLKARQLSHPSSPLLRKLQMEAPGTYHHCLMIGTLAEVVSTELGIDENLMKVGAYYHDIGKLRRPQYFVENQMGGKNIHDDLPPTLSAVTIIAHVREGVELAGEFGLPKKVKQFITEHHGTTSVGYFYKKAKAMGENVDLSQFTYPGPKPQSRETALLMLLDSLEAAMRAESRNITSVKDIQEVIERVIAIKIADRQFDDVDFTFREMERVKAALLRAFRSMYHTRVVKEIKQEAKQEAKQKT